MAFLFFWLTSTTAVATPYLALFLADRGMNESQIGLVNAAPLVSVLILNMLVGHVADRRTGWRRTIVAGALLALLTPFALPFAHDPMAILVCWAMTIVPVSLIIPIADATGARYSRQEGRNFSRIRVWGTIGHVSVTAAATLLVGWFGIAAFVPMLVGIAFFRFVAALSLPDIKARPVADDAAPELLSGMAIMARPWFVLPLLGVGLITASHTMQNALGALYWDKAGLSGMQIGVLWLVAGLAEVLLMYLFPLINRRIPARVLLILAGLASALRWGGFALEPGFWTLMALQTLHMASFGLTYLAGVAFLVSWTPDEIAARAQSALSLSRQLCTMLMFVAVGFLAEGWGVRTYWFAAAIALGGTLSVAASLLLRPARTRETG